MNEVGLGLRGITSKRVEANHRSNSYAIRGDFDLLNLSEKSTSVKYYSGWIDDANIKLYLTTVPQELPKQGQANPIAAIAKQPRTVKPDR